MGHLLAESSYIYNFLKHFVHGICCIVFATIRPSWPPSCGTNAFCREGVFVCNVGYLGDGYNCTCLNDFEATNQVQF